MGFNDRPVSNVSRSQLLYTWWVTRGSMIILKDFSVISLYLIYQPCQPCFDMLWGQVNLLIRCTVLVYIKLTTIPQGRNVVYIVCRLLQVVGYTTHNFRKKSEVRSGKSEVGSQQSEVRSRKSEVPLRLS